jgi:hypothetical protein
MSLALLEDAADSAGGGVLFVAEGTRGAEFVAVARGLLLLLDVKGATRLGEGDDAQPLDRLATEYPTCATIPDPLHQVSYSCHGPRRGTPCRTCHLHTMRQVNAILQTKQR